MKGHVPFGGRRLHAITGALPATVTVGPPGSRPSNTKADLPGAVPCHVGCWYRTPRRRQGRQESRHGSGLRG